MRQFNSILFLFQLTAFSYPFEESGFTKSYPELLSDYYLHHPATALHQEIHSTSDRRAAESVIIHSALFFHMASAANGNKTARSTF